MLYVCAAAPITIQQDELESAAFNDPLQEFALLEELRTSRFGPSDLRVLTKRPLAIYSPARSFEPWQLGRAADRFRRHSYQLEKDQAARRVTCRVCNWRSNDSTSCSFTGCAVTMPRHSYGKA